MGEKQNLTSEDLSYFSLNDLKREVNNKKLTRQKNEYNSSKLIFLPQVIENSGDIDVVRLPLGQPTFITQEKLISRIIKLNDMRKDLKKIRDKIVCIKNHIRIYKQIYIKVNFFFKLIISFLESIYQQTISYP